MAKNKMVNWPNTMALIMTSESCVPKWYMGTNKSTVLGQCLFLSSVAVDCAQVSAVNCEDHHRESLVPGVVATRCTTNSMGANRRVFQRGVLKESSELGPLRLGLKGVNMKLVR